MFLTKREQSAHAGNTGLRFERAWFVVNARMNDPTVVARLVSSKTILFFEDR
jgi:hypothetical protein